MPATQQQQSETSVAVATTAMPSKSKSISKSSLIFDIETGPLPDDQLREFCDPYQPPPHPGEFDPAAVKLGNLKDQAKITAKLDEARAAHELAVANHGENCQACEAAHWLQQIERAALSPVTGRVLAIGLRSSENGKSGIMDGKGSEADLLAQFWVKYLQCRKMHRSMIGCNITGFDLPFLIRRSWIVGVEVPWSVVVNRRYFDAVFVDLRDVWLLGQRWNDCPSSLDLMARALGVGKKPDDIGGGDFAKLWLGTAEEKARATAYLLNDLDMTARVAERLGVV